MATNAWFLGEWKSSDAQNYYPLKIVTLDAINALRYYSKYDKEFR
jgi:hypothetical protein